MGGKERGEGEVDEGERNRERNVLENRETEGEREDKVAKGEEG